MSHYVVERQTGLPSGETPRKYPFPTLNVGDSIKVKGAENFKQARMAAYQYGRRHKKTFYTEVTKQGGRITRTK